MAVVRYEITNGDLRAAVWQKGAELCSLRRGQAGREYIWQADPAVWDGSAPILFPIVGKLKNDAYEFEGETYSMPGHGIVRRRDFTVRDSSKSSISLVCVSNADSRASYPFDFELQVDFRLFEARLVVDYTVRNIGKRPMPFTIGSHPAFAVHPDAAGIEDYRIEFSDDETLDLYQLEGTLIGNPVQPHYLDSARHIDLHPGIFDNDALIFKHIQSTQISLVNKNNGPEVTLDTGGAPHLGIWSKPGGRYVCIEPWHGYSDAVTATGRLQDKLSMKWLDPGYSFDAGYSVSIA